MNDNEANLANVVSQMANFSSVDVNSLGVPDFLAVLGISLLASFYIALLYNRFYQSRATGSQAHHAFPLLGLSVTSIFICIQFSLPLSLGLLGALSIVRFRTPIKEPEEVAFIMLVIASSICCATFNFIFLTVILGMAVVGMLVARWAQKRSRGKLPGGMLTITLAFEEYKMISSELIAFLATRIPAGTLDGTQESESTATVSYSFPALQADSLVEVQNDIRSMASTARSNLYVHHAGAL
jgi:hypothetical protein